MTELGNIQELNDALESFDMSDELSWPELETLQKLNNTIDNFDSWIEMKNLIKEWIENNMLSKFKLWDLAEKLKTNNDITEQEVWNVFGINQDEDNRNYEHWWDRNQIIGLLQLYLKTINFGRYAFDLTQDKNSLIKKSWVDGFAGYRTADALTEYARDQHKKLVKLKEKTSNLYLSNGVLDNVKIDIEKVSKLIQDLESFNKRWFPYNYIIDGENTLWDTINILKDNLNKLEKRKIELENNQKAINFVTSYWTKYSWLGYNQVNMEFIYEWNNRESFDILKFVEDWWEEKLIERYDKMKTEWEQDNLAESFLIQLLNQKNFLTEIFGKDRYKWIKYDKNKNVFTYEWINPLSRDEILSIPDFKERRKILKNWIKDNKTKKEIPKNIDEWSKSDFFGTINYE